MDHYNAYGWVKLEGLVNRESVDLVLHAAYELMGKDGDSNPVVDSDFRFFNLECAGGVKTDSFRPLLQGLGNTAKALMAREGIGARLLGDHFSAKLPVGGTFKHGSSTRTDFHQDFPITGVDRAGGVNIWLALVDVVPDMGAMSFLSGSHRLGPLAVHYSHMGRDLPEVYPKLERQCASSGPMTYKAGDVTAHNILTVHGAGENRTDRVRWSYITNWLPSDACWNGAQSELFGPLEKRGLMRPFGLLDDGEFPILSD